MRDAVAERARSHLSLRFTGAQLIVVGGRIPNLSMPAKSGMEGKADPIPKGEWRIHLDEVVDIPFLADLKIKALAAIKYGSIEKGFDAHRSAWGRYRIYLHPFDVDGARRDGFFIHGGDMYGSLGCIDISHWMDYFVVRLAEEHKDTDPKAVYVPVTVE
jgi:hypothetical protein